MRKIYWYQWREKQKEICIAYHCYIKNILFMNENDDGKYGLICKYNEIDKYYNWRFLNVYSIYHRINSYVDLPQNYYYSNGSKPPNI